MGAVPVAAKHQGVSRYRRFGADADVPLLCLRDPWDAIEAWDPLIIEGLASGRSLILIDRPALVDSNRLLAEAVRWKAEQVIEIIKHSSDGRVDVLGYSMGGLIAQCVVSLQPELVRRVVFANAVTGLSGGEGTLESGPVRARLLSLLFAASDTSQEAGRAFLQRIRAGPDDWGRLEKALDLLSLRAQPDQCCLQSSKGCDSLIITAADDAVAPIDTAFALAADLPGSRFIVYPDAGHGAPFQYPTLFVHQVDHFLRAGRCT
ncbi:MAG: alpha/beta fold hydrolase [Rhodospirillales bacterium]|nr:alpha/beta fold hydrolase [Rhodospirillales bacterium]